jgi:hypothetical protein
MFEFGYGHSTPITAFAGIVRQGIKDCTTRGQIHLGRAKFIIHQYQDHGIPLLVQFQLTDALTAFGFIKNGTPFHLNTLILPGRFPADGIVSAGLILIHRFQPQLDTGIVFGNFTTDGQPSGGFQR